MPQLTFIDRLIIETDALFRTLLPPVKRPAARENPGKNIADAALTLQEKKHIAGLMRVNHAGEVCAQALYQGQALTAHSAMIKKQMTNAALEETDHLAWCEERLQELTSRPSSLNLIWYLGSLTLGALAGLVGDRLSLGFVAETENQVSTHLRKHLSCLPAHDERTKAILEQMLTDESQHADTAWQAGAVNLPVVVKRLMKGAAKIMTSTSYYL